MACSSGPLQITGSLLISPTLGLLSHLLFRFGCLIWAGHAGRAAGSGGGGLAAGEEAGAGPLVRGTPRSARRLPPRSHGDRHGDQP